uniref:Uncharacterized protein n=1 Tax=Arundo donax TaxID=35708 RepID=A0A0A8ZU93_ARUDO
MHFHDLLGSGIKLATDMGWSVTEFHKVLVLFLINSE